MELELLKKLKKHIIDNWFYYILFIPLLIISISRVNFMVFGDSATYLLNCGKLQNEYFSQNFHSLLNGGEFSSLTTEGGWPFLLYISSCIHEYLPFFLAAMLLPLFLILCLQLLRLNINSKNKSLIIFGSLILLIFFNLKHDVGHIIWMLSAPLRDVSAHSITFIMLICFSIFLNSLKTKKFSFKKQLCLLATTGFLGGLSGWFRIPNIMLLLPVFIIFLVYVIPLFSKMQILKCVLVLGFGFLIGIIPIFAQTFLEGKPIYQIGQFDLLVGTQQALPQHDHLDLSQQEIIEISSDNVMRGLHLHNFRYTFPKTLGLLTKYFYTKSGVLLAVLLIGIGLRYNTKRVLLFLLCSLMILCFYSCYDKFIARYIILHVIFTFFAASLGAVCLLEQLILKFKFLQKKYSLQALDICACIFLVIIVFANKYYDGFKDISQSYKAMKEYNATINLLVQKDDIIFNTPFNVWTELYSPSKAWFWRWKGNDNDINSRNAKYQLQKTIETFNHGNDIYVAQLSSKGVPFKNWELNDINLHFKLEYMTNITINNFPEIVLFKVDREPDNSYAIDCSGNKENILIWCEDKTGTSKFPVSLVAGNKNKEFSVNQGINIFSLKNDDAGQYKHLMIKPSEEGMPNFIFTKEFDNKIELDLTDFPFASIIDSTFSGGMVVWSNYNKQYQKETLSWIRHPQRQISTYISVNESLSFPISVDPIWSENLSISLYIDCRNKNLAFFKDVLQNSFQYKINEFSLYPTIQEEQLTSVPSIVLNFKISPVKINTSGVNILSIHSNTKSPVNIHKVVFSVK